MAQRSYGDGFDDLEDDLDDVAIAEARARGTASGIRTIAGIAGIIVLLLDAALTWQLMRAVVENWNSIDALVVLALNGYAVLLVIGIMIGAYVWTRAMD